MEDNDEAEVKALVETLLPQFERVPLAIAADALGIVLANHCVWRVFTGETVPEIMDDMVDRARGHIALRMEVARKTLAGRELSQEIVDRYIAEQREKLRITGGVPSAVRGIGKPS